MNPHIMFDALRKAENGVEISLCVIPNADRTALAGYDEWKHCFKFKTNALAEKNKANRALLDFFQSLFGKEVALTKGERSRNKTILVLGATLEDVSDKLEKQK
ncbi:MAG: YggU family protein [Candidatus Altiarchaeota archaeon]|nr:YggU family protein [Candidatus Altiarchaeota archaeon]